MKHLAPEGPIYQAGTLSGNPLAMAAGIATLTPLFDDGVYAGLEARTKKLAEGLAERARKVGLKASPTCEGSMFSCFLTESVPSNFDDVKAQDTGLFGRYFWAMLERGVYLAPSAFEAGFVSLCQYDGIIDQTLDAAEGAFAEAVKG